MAWRIEVTPRAFAEIAASGVGRQLLQAIRELEAGRERLANCVLVRHRRGADPLDLCGDKGHGLARHFDRKV
jgi:hypothetical protein